LKRKVEISAVVPVCDEFDRSGSLAVEYLGALDATNYSFELIYVIVESYTEVKKQLMDLAKRDSRVRILQLTRNFGTAAFLSAGFENSTGDVILTLSADYKIESADIPKLLTAVNDCDLAIGVRHSSRPLPGFARIRRRLFHWLIRKVSGQRFVDLSCGVRALRRRVAEEVTIYGEQDTFFPLLAVRRGFRVREVTVEESARSPHLGLYSPGTYLRRALDILTILFLVRFTKKPLRFFGVIGSVVLAVGTTLLTVVVIQRLFFGVALADRPALLLSSLLVVLGMQIFAIGLLGELIIFSHAGDIKEYYVEEIIN
jgi:glycosyltransferase involved in cell wall biosynthesis